MKTRIIRLSTLLVCLLASCVIMLVGVWAATTQSLNINTSVSFTPGVLAKVEAIVYRTDGSSYTQTIFDNYNKNTTVSPKIELKDKSDPPNNIPITSANTIEFIVTNYNSSALTLTLSEISCDNPIELLSENGDVISVAAITAKTASSSGETATTSKFRLNSIFYNTSVTLKIDLTIQS